MKKHILLFLDYYLPHCGGVETVFEQIIQRFRKKGYHITLVTSRFDSKLKAYESLENLDIYRTGSSRLSFLFRSFFLGFKILRSKKIDIIHTSTYVGVFPSVLLGRLFHKKVVVTVHEVFGKLWKLYKGNFWGGIYLLFEKLLFLLPCDMYQCVSKYTMNSLRLMYGIPDNKLAVVYNGVDYDFWDPDKVHEQEIIDFKRGNAWNGRFVVLYFGHAGKSKGLDYLIECIPQMVKHDPDVLFVFNIIDSKRRKKTLERLHFLEKFGFARQIQLFEGVDKVYLRQMISACDVVVAPSLSEGFGSVHTETVAMNKPLITTYIASLPEVVGGKTIFIQPGSTSQILDAILTMKEQPDSVELLPRKFFDWNASLEKIEDIYDSLS